MKKLMFAAMAVAAAGVATADPLVYDYKASTKQLALKDAKVKLGGVTWDIYVKYQTSASLKGYLIVDTDGATSTAIQTLAGSGNSVPATCPWDYGRNRAFLVVQNSKAEKAVRFPKIIPAVLDAKWIQSKANATTGIAEGYLYAGGELKAGQVREALDLYNNVMIAPTRTANAAEAFIQDYCWTSIYLFGQYNGPLFFTGLWDNAEAAIDGAMDAGLAQGFTAATDYFYHDSWLNGAGFGKWSTGKNKKACCGATAAAGKVLDTLSGNLKGGLFLCTEPCTNFDGGYVLLDTWEDQFLTKRDTAGVATWSAAGDYDQVDLWQDGGLELNTRDCISGTWSIKFNTKLAPVTITNDEIDALNAGAGLYTEDAKGLKVLLNYIKGAALKLNKDVILASGNEIWDEVTAYHDQVTFLTPQFCAYYGLRNFK